jgi:hypothetical protein
VMMATLFASLMIVSSLDVYERDFATSRNTWLPAGIGAR